MSGLTKANVKKLHLQAFQNGRGQDFVASLRKIIEQLRTNPLDFGEPLYRLPTLQLAVRQGVIDPIIVNYGVHEEKDLVFIRGFKLLS
jgi:hypothetical protein